MEVPKLGSIRIDVGLNIDRDREFRSPETSPKGIPSNAKDLCDFSF